MTWLWTICYVVAVVLFIVWILSASGRDSDDSRMKQNNGSGDQPAADASDDEPGEH